MGTSFSVVIPLYNHEKYIASTLYSVLNQSYPAREIIVIDDGSRDGGPQIVQALAKNRPEIIFWSQPNRGAHSAINAGVMRATSDVVAILNSDDLYHPNRLERVANAFENSAADAVFTDCAFCNGDGDSISFDWYEEALSYFKSTGDYEKSLINGNFILTTTNIAVRRSVFEEVGGFSNLRYAHDLDFFLRLSLMEKNIVGIGGRLATYRIHGTNTISEGHDKVRLEWAAVAACYLAGLCARKGWGEIARFYEVLERHDLMRMMVPLISYFYASGVQSLERHEFHHDEKFKGVIKVIV